MRPRAGLRIGRTVSMRSIRLKERWGTRDERGFMRSHRMRLGMSGESRTSATRARCCVRISATSGQRRWRFRRGCRCCGRWRRRLGRGTVCTTSVRLKPGSWIGCLRCCGVEVRGLRRQTWRKRLGGMRRGGERRELWRALQTNRGLSVSVEMTGRRRIRAAWGAGSATASHRRVGCDWRWWPSRSKSRSPCR